MLVVTTSQVDTICLCCEISHYHFDQCMPATYEDCSTTTDDSCSCLFKHSNKSGSQQGLVQKHTAHAFRLNSTALAEQHHQFDFLLLHPPSEFGFLVGLEVMGSVLW